MNIQINPDRPPEKISEWNATHHKTHLTFWEQISKNLENEPNCTKQTIITEDDMVDGVLPSVGTTVPVDYVVDPLVGPVKTEWQVLGYNMSIPERIKYKNGNDVIYVTTVKNGLLAPIVKGTMVYGEKDSVESIGSVSGTSGVNQTTVADLGTYTVENRGTYGNNNPYNAPTSVTVGGEEYSFAGWNMTLMSKYGLAAKYKGALYCFPQFRSYEKSLQNRSDWSTSDIREWMNGTSAVKGQKWYIDTWYWGSNKETGRTGIVGLMGRLTDESFMKHVSPCVNRTWVHDDWRSGKALDSNYCEHVVDKFWLLGKGNINAAQLWMKDDIYETSKFTAVFTSDTESRVRKHMNEDGEEGSVCFWWLRSARDLGFLVGHVSRGGNIDRACSGHYLCACLPVCLIQ